MNLFSGYISEKDGVRENNFTFLRILCAWLVIYGHSYALQNPNNINDPLNLIFKGSNYIGGFAVDAFFIISGYLVAGSFVRNGAFSYVVSRILRIFPALIVCVLFSIFILGLAVTTLDPASYLAHPQTHSYFINLIPFYDVKYFLPGVFEHNMNPAVNGSLWTLIVELRCYFLLLILGVLGVFGSRFISNIALVGLLFFGAFFFKDLPFLGRGETIKWPTLSLFFLIGVAFYVNRKDILLNCRLACLAVIVAFLSFGSQWFTYFFPAVFAYIIFYVVYSLPFIDVDKKIGDISYGIYIYAFPVQGLIAFLCPSVGPFVNFLLSSVIVIPLAYCSWHLIEEPALKFKEKIMSFKLIQVK